MREWYKHNLRYKSVAWVVIAAVLALTVIPVHLHFHHVDEGAALHHEVDLHVEAGLSDHSHHDETHILKASPDTLAKLFDHAAKIFAPLAFLVLLLPVAYVGHSVWRRAAPAQTRNSYHYLIPHLRAPPRH